MIYVPFGDKNQNSMTTHFEIQRLFCARLSTTKFDFHNFVTQNQFNSIQIPKFCVSKADNDLFKLYLWLDKHKKTKDIRYVDKDIFYIHGKMLCDKKVNKEFEINKLSDVKTIKKKKYDVGEEVYFNLDRKLDINKSEKLSFGIIKNKNRNKYDILYPGNLDKKYKIYKNITLENIRKYIY